MITAFGAAVGAAVSFFVAGAVVGAAAHRSLTATTPPISYDVGEEVWYLYRYSRGDTVAADRCKIVDVLPDGYIINRRGGEVHVSLADAELLLRAISPDVTPFPTE